MWRLSDELSPHLGLTFDLTVKRNTMIHLIEWRRGAGGWLRRRGWANFIIILMHGAVVISRSFILFWTSWNSAWNITANHNGINEGGRKTLLIAEKGSWHKVTCRIGLWVKFVYLIPQSSLPYHYHPPPAIFDDFSARANICLGQRQG